MPSKGIPPSFITRQILAWCERLALWFMCLTSLGQHSKYPVQFVEWVPGKKGQAFHREISEAKRNSPSSSLSTPHSFLWSIYILFASLLHNGSFIQYASLNKTEWIWPQSSAELKGGKAEMVLRKSVGRQSSRFHSKSPRLDMGRSLLMSQPVLPGKIQLQPYSQVPLWEESLKIPIFKKVPSWWFLHTAVWKVLF